MARRRTRKRLLTSRSNHSEQSLWEAVFCVRAALWWFGAVLLKLWHLNPLSLLLRRQRHLYGLEDAHIKPPWSEWFADFFRSDDSRKQKLLQWVQALLPRVGVEDFTASWHDGLVLCSLLEEVSPGLCPRPELLKPHHRVNNCRLGVRLAQRYLAVNKMMLTAEEMAIADADIEMKIVHLVQLIKWRHQRGGAVLSPSSSALHRARASAAAEPIPIKVIARGTGLKAGIVGRRAKFNILTDSVSFLDLHIAVQGPNNEMNSERITSITQGLERRGARVRVHPLACEEDGRTKVIEDDVGNVFLRQKSVDEEQCQSVIPFDYQCVGEGRFLVTYIPRSPGTYFISIKSQEVDIEGSPFEVKVSDWMSSWNVIPKPRAMPFDMLPSIQEVPSRENTSPLRHNVVRDPRRASSRHRMTHVPVMKKRVLKRVITRNGEEVLLTPSPTVSRQSSADMSDFSEDDSGGRGSSETSFKVRSPTLGGKERSLSKAAPLDAAHEDFANNSCNITLSVSSFDDDEPQKKLQEQTQQHLHHDRHQQQQQQQQQPLSPAPPPPPQQQQQQRRPEDSATSQSISPFSPANDSRRERPQYTSYRKTSTPTTYDMTPGMYPSSPKRLPRTTESPIHINVRSQLLGPSGVTHSASFPTPGSSANCKDDNDASLTSKAPISPRRASEGSISSCFLTVSPRRPLSSLTSTSDDNTSDVTSDAETSPHPHYSRPSPTTHNKTNSADENDSPSENPLANRTKLTLSPSASANYRRFEETISQRDGDADDSGAAYSRLVSALTEYHPSATATPRKPVGRSFSDGARAGGWGWLGLAGRREELCRLVGYTDGGGARGGGAASDVCQEEGDGGLFPSKSGVRKGAAKERHYNIRLKRTDGSGADCTWNSSDPDAATKSSWTLASGNPRAVIVQSDSLSKTCAYGTARSLSLQSRPSVDSTHSPQDHAYGRHLGVLDHPSRNRRRSLALTSSSSGSVSIGDDERRGDGGLSSPSSASEAENTAEVDVFRNERPEEKGGGAVSRRGQLDLAKRKWKTVDGGTVVEHEGEWGDHPRWRFSLQGRRSQSFSTPGWHSYSPQQHNTRLPYGYSEFQEFENMSILDKLTDDDEILEVVIESSEPSDLEEYSFLDFSPGRRAEPDDPRGGAELAIRGAEGLADSPSGGSTACHQPQENTGDVEKLPKDPLLQSDDPNKHSPGTVLEKEDENGSDDDLSEDASEGEAQRIVAEHAGRTKLCSVKDEMQKVERKEQMESKQEKQDVAEMRAVLDESELEDAMIASVGIKNGKPPRDVDKTPHRSGVDHQTSDKTDAERLDKVDKENIDKVDCAHKERSVKTDRELSYKAVKGASEKPPREDPDKENVEPQSRHPATKRGVYPALFSCKTLALDGGAMAGGGRGRPEQAAAEASRKKARRCATVSTEEEFETSASDTNTDISVATSSRPRGSLSRQDNVKTSASSSNTSMSGTTNTDASAAETTDKSRANSADLSTDTTGDEESRRFRTIQQPKAKVREGASVSILAPKPKVDKATQASYPDIKAETGWQPPRVRLHKRKKYVKIDGACEVIADAISSINEVINNVKNNQLASISRQSSVSGKSDKSGKSVESVKPVQLGVYNISASLDGSVVSTKFGDVSGKSFGDTDSSVGNSKKVLKNSSDLKSIKCENLYDFLTYLDQKEQTSAQRDLNALPKKTPDCQESSPETETGVAPMSQAGNKNVTSDARDSQQTGIGGLTAVSRVVDESVRGHECSSSSDNSISGGGQGIGKGDHSHHSVAAIRHHIAARVHPYSRASSDPQFNRYPDPLLFGVGHVDRRRGGGGEGEGGGTSSRPEGGRSAGGLGSRPHVLDWVERLSERQQEGSPRGHCSPERQSTVDTLDSGIENESPVYGSYVSGHRRLHRRPYPWSVDLDPALVRANAAAAAAHGNRRLTRRPYPWECVLDPPEQHQRRDDDDVDDHDDERLPHQQRQQLNDVTLGAIEAVVELTVQKLLTGSSEGSPFHAAGGAASRHQPHHQDLHRHHQPLPWERELTTTSLSDSELYLGQARAATLPKRKRKRPARPAQKPQQPRRALAAPGMTAATTPCSTSVLEDFFRSVAVLTGESGSSATRLQDVGETKSDGRFSPYSVTDIPCFELPAGALRIRRSRGCRLSPGPDDVRIPRQRRSSGKPKVGAVVTSSSPDTSAVAGGQVSTDARHSKELLGTLAPGCRSFISTESDTGTSEESLGLRQCHMTSAPTGVRSRPGEGRNPRIVIHGSSLISQQPSVDDPPAGAGISWSTSSEPEARSAELGGYTGFGVSRAQRQELIHRLRTFRDLTERQRSAESSDGSRRGPSPSLPEDLSYVLDAASLSSSHLSDPFDHNSPLSPTSFFAPASFGQGSDSEADQGGGGSPGEGRRQRDFSSISISNDNTILPSSTHGRELLGSDGGSGRPGSSGSSIISRLRLSPLQARIAHAHAPEGGRDATPRDPDGRRGRCMAYGAGLSFGQVGVANNFQVWTEGAENGCVTVAVFGPRSHCVTETSVTYVGDHVYDVTFSVTSPGYYVIVVKWGERSLPDSPFICKVTY